MVSVDSIIHWIVIWRAGMAVGQSLLFVNKEAFVFFVISCHLLVFGDEVLTSYVGGGCVYVRGGRRFVFKSFSFRRFLDTFVILFTIVSVVKSVPVVLGLGRGKEGIGTGGTANVSFTLLVNFFCTKSVVLGLFRISVTSFTITNTFIVFLVSLRVVLSVRVFGGRNPVGRTALIPLIFPLLTNTKTFAALLSLHSRCTPMGVIMTLVLGVI